MADVQAAAGVEAEIREFFGRWAEAYGGKDAEALVAMATGDVMIIGTGADEVRFGIDGYREQAERDLSQAESLDASFDNLRVSTHGDVAFAYVEPVIRATVGGQSLTLDGLRATFGLVRTPDGWRLAQGHLSVPDSQQEPGQSF